MTKTLCVVLLLAFAAFGQQQERIAIMHTVDNIDSINFSDLSYLTDKLRDIASKILPKSRYGIMTQQSIVDWLGSHERMVKECKEATCLADLGRKISADYIAQGYVGRFSGELTIKVELYNVRSGTLIGAITGDSRDLKGLLSVLESKAPKLFEDMAGGPSAVPEKPAPLPPEPPPVPPEPMPEPPPAPADPDVPLKLNPLAFLKCKSTFNINELVFKIQSSFTNQLNDCSAALAKNIAMSKSPFGKKTELKEPKAFMMECTVDGIKQKLPSGIDEYIKPIKSFVQSVLDGASGANGELDVAKLSKAIGDMNIDELLNGIRKLAEGDDCMADMPYEPPAASGGENEGSGSEDKEVKRKELSLGLRGGFGQNLQLGLILDITVSDWFHFQPGLVYIQDYYHYKTFYVNDNVEGLRFHTKTLHYINFPLLLSFKIFAFRINAGPYVGICVNYDNSLEDFNQDSGNNAESSSDFGLSAGFGFDIGRFYIGMLYYLDFLSNNYHNMGGFNLGVNFGL